MTQLTAEQPVAASQEQQPLVHAIGLTKVFKDFWLRDKAKAVDGISFDVRPGEVFGLLGPNGSGKSTTIKMILGLLRPTAGKVLVLGKRPDDVAAKKRIGYLPEESYLYRFLDARETLDYYGRLFKLDAHQRSTRTEKLLTMVGLESVARRSVGEYSKGMQRRIGLAQALINDPDLLILDEPTTGMDPIGTRQIKDLIIELAGRGKTIILCSHLLADVEDVCDRVAIMFGGKIRASGTVKNLLTVQDQTTIQTQALDNDTIEQVEKLLASRGKHVQRVDQPRQKLEALFLDIVNKAQAEGAATSGAKSGGPIADFLTSAADAQTQRVIQSLVQPPTPPTPSQSPAPAPAAPTPVEPPTDSAIIDSLVGKWGGQESTAKDSPQADAPAPQPADHFEEPPSPDELTMINKLGASWGQPEKPAAPAPPAEASKPAPTPPGEEEKPDTSFLDALTKVEPWRENEGKKDQGS